MGNVKDSRVSSGRKRYNELFGARSLHPLEIADWFGIATLQSVLHRLVPHEPAQ